MRISDWSSDVCSSDLPAALAPVAARLASAEPEHRARHLFEDVGEILGAHHRIVHRQPGFLAERLLDHRLTEGDSAAIANGDRETFLDRNLGGAAVRHGDTGSAAIEVASDHQNTFR